MVIALVGLIFILLLVFVLIIRGQSKKYAKKSDSGERLGGHPRGDLMGGLPGMQEEQNARGMGREHAGHPWICGVPAGGVWGEPLRGTPACFWGPNGSVRPQAAPNPPALGLPPPETWWIQEDAAGFTERAGSSRD